MKIQTNPDALEAKLKAAEHLQSAEGVVTVLTTVAVVSKFWLVMTDEEQDLVNAAKLTVEKRLEWKRQANLLKRVSDLSVPEPIN